MENDYYQTRALSAPGKLILEEIVKPQLSDAVQYDRVSSYYSPRSLLLLLREFGEIWKQGRSIRLIIGFHEKMEISPALKSEVEVRKAMREAVKEALRGSVDELARLVGSKEDILSMIRELINHKALHVRLVTAKANFRYYLDKGHWPDPEIALFHSKFTIIHKKSQSKGSQGPERKGLMDSIRRVFRLGGRKKDYYRSSYVRLGKGEEFSVVVGSANESLGGYGNNIEDAVLQRSWVKEEREIAAYFVDRFESLWIDAAEDVITMPFDEEFESIFEEAKVSVGHKLFRWEDFWNFVKRSPGYHCLAFPNIGLLPHQIRVYREALNRWPIRALMADEVGLGKTIEAGSVIHYLIEHCGVQRVAIFVPASLRRQWQQELKNLFGLEFWIYDPSSGVCELDDESVYVGNRPLSQMDRVIISWHWARMNVTDDSCRFDGQEMPELLVVDEAHHARRRKNIRGEIGSTQLHKLLRHMQKRIPHILLLTATPFQTSQMDYFSLLEILGLPDGFTERSLEQFSRWTKGELHRSFSIQVRQIKQLHSLLSEYGINAREDIVRPLLDVPCTDNTEFYEEYHLKYGELPDELVLKYHPTTLLTLRNTRDGLRKQGYSFPNVDLLGADIYISEDQAHWFEDLEDYIRDRLGYVLSGLNTSRNIGLMKSLYRQRAVSSIKAAVDTLSRRAEKLNRFLETRNPSWLKEGLEEEFSATNNEPDDSAPDLVYPQEKDEMVQSLMERAKTEKYHLDRLVTRMDELFERDGSYQDPKMERLRELVDEHVQTGRRVLVFSRFTSTTEAAMNELKDFAAGGKLGRFDGVHVGIYSLKDSEMTLEDSSDKEIVGSLKSGAIDVLVCSDKASEGLNLHAANVAINVDVPWNPTRLLQRFGRVDRLGQKADDVYLVNMYYPNSIEERMYKVLEDRRIDFRALLGQVPEIISEQQRKVIEDLARNTGPHIGLTQESIQAARERFNSNQYNHLIIREDANEEAKSIQSRMIEIVKDGAKEAGSEVVKLADETFEINGERISSDPLDDGYSSWGSENWRKFETPQKSKGIPLELSVIENRLGKPLALVAKKGQSIIPLRAKDWPKLFGFLFKGEPVVLDGLRRFEVDEVDDALKYIRDEESWVWPDHARMQTISETDSAIPSADVVSLGDSLGFVYVKDQRQTMGRESEGKVS